MKPTSSSQERDRIPRPPAPRDAEQTGREEGPRRPRLERPDTDDILQRMRRVDPDQARRYRQRTGQ